MVFSSVRVPITVREKTFVLVHQSLHVTSRSSESDVQRAAIPVKKTSFCRVMWIRKSTSGKTTRFESLPKADGGEFYIRSDVISNISTASETTAKRSDD